MSSLDRALYNNAAVSRELHDDSDSTGHSVTLVSGDKGSDTPRASAKNDRFKVFSQEIS